MLVAQNFLMVKMAGQSFGRKQNYGLTVTVSSEEWCPGWSSCSRRTPRRRLVSHLPQLPLLGVILVELLVLFNRGNAVS
jgi:hypothetical protein